MAPTLLPYQREGVEALRWFDGRALLCDEVGLGKSVQSIAYGVEEDLFPMLVVCPASLKENWRREFHKHYGMDARVLSGLASERRKGPVPPVTVVNYDLLEGRLSELLKLKPRYVVGDEAHYLQSRTAKRTKAFRKLARSAGRVVLPTGTPVTNRPSELWSLINVVRPDLFPSFFCYAQAHCNLRKLPWGWSYDGAKRLPELHDLLLRECMVRRRKADVLKDLPAKQKFVVPLELTDRREYDAAAGDFASWVARNRPQDLAGALRAQALGRANRLRQIVARAKMKAVIGWVEDFLASGEKLLLFAYHREVVQDLSRHFRGRCVTVYGGVTGHDRQVAFDSFNDDSGVRLFVGQVRAAGQGWSCTSASNVAFCELDWSPNAHAQAEGRTHGLSRGVEGSVSTSWYLLGADTVDEQQAQALDEKSRVITGLLDGGETAEQAVFDLFLQAMKRR